MYKKNTRYSYLIVSSVIFKILISISIIFLGYNYWDSHKFFTDAYTIYNYYTSIDKSQLFHFSTNGFENMARIYKIILANKSANFITILIVSQILYFCIFIFMIYTLRINTNKKLFICFLLFFVFDAIFLAQPSKDQFSLLVSIVIFRCIRSEKKRKNIYIIIALLAYAFLFRSYYVIILALYYFIKLLNKSKKYTSLFLIMVLFVLIYYLFNNTSYLDSLINVRPLSESQLQEKTNTLIQNIIPYSYGEKNFVYYIINYIINLFRIIFPVETLWKSFTRGILFVPIQLFVIYILFKYIKILKYKFAEHNVISNIIIYVISFILVQALFEPDFGSVFRHSMNLMPFYLYLYFSIDYAKIFKEIKENNILENIKKEKHKKIKIVWNRI